jgi:hypothetical protein
MAALGCYHSEEVSSAILANSVNADPTFIRKSLRTFPVRREWLQGPGLAVEQWRAERIFQVLNSAGHSRLREMESRRCRHNGTAIHNGNKSLQVNEVHEFLSPFHSSL